MVTGFRGGLLDLRGDQVVVVVARRIAGFHDAGDSKSAVRHVEAVVVAVGAAHRTDAVDNLHPHHLVVVHYSCTLTHFDMVPPRCMDSARAKSSGNKLTLKWSGSVSSKIRLESRLQNRCESFRMVLVAVGCALAIWSGDIALEMPKCLLFYR